MLVQRTCCLNWLWQRQISNPSSPGCAQTRFLLHHGYSLPPSSKPFRRDHMLLRAFRTNARQQLSRADALRTKPFEDLIKSGGSVPPGNVVKALLFTGTFTVGCFMGATVLEYENARNTMMDKVRQTKFSWLQRKTLFEEPNKWQKLKKDMRHYWDQLTPGERVFAPICAINLLVFALWRVPALRNTMTTYFCSNPAARSVCWPMFLSTFSHYSTFHIFANMYVLHSFANAAVLSLGKEQFLAVYLSAGVFASFASVMYKAITSQAGLSIGASGAIMAILAYVCAQYPDTQLSILFLPMLTFSAGSAIKVIMGLDVAGCLLGWKFFDHAAHLGGALYGIFWAYYGSQLWQKRITFLSMYHDWRKTK